MSELIKIAKEPFEVFVDEDGFWRRPPERDQIDMGNVRGKWLLINVGEEIPAGVLAHLERHQPGWVTEGVLKVKKVEEIKPIVNEKPVKVYKNTVEMNKDELEEYAFDKFKVSLDKRKNIKLLLKQVLELEKHG